jgi:F-type H+-transporting ATPase subunit delta
MQKQTVARRYATAVFLLAKERGVTGAVASDLHAAATAIASDPDAGRFFVSPVIDRAEKAKVICATFEGKVGEVVLHTLLLLVRKRREALLDGIVHEYDALHLAERGLEPLEIASARPLQQAELEDLVARLGRLYGARFEVTTRVDPALLGGVRITLGDRSIDGSIAGRLDAIARNLDSLRARHAAGPPATS